MIFTFPWLKRFAWMFELMEGLAINHATGIVATCQSIADAIEKYASKPTITLWDIPPQTDKPCDENLRQKLGINENVLVLYVGGLEPYHGIDLLLESFAGVSSSDSLCSLVLIGGAEDEIARYRILANSLGLHGSAHFLGRRPIEQLQSYLAQADVLVSAITGRLNFPMKIFSYFESGKCILATDVPAHTQLLRSDVALLAAATPEHFARGMARLIHDRSLRSQLGQSAKKAASNYTHSEFQEKIRSFYTRLLVQAG
jgi:glycosyltransferase involved in cell wall biosynthesis